LNGTVTRAAGGQAIQGAQVEALNMPGNRSYNATTDSNGNYTLTNPVEGMCVPAGNIKVRASANRFKTKTIDPVIVPPGGSVKVPIQLDCTQVKVNVVDSANLGIAGVLVMLLDTSGTLLLDLNGQPYIANTGLDGSVTFNCVPHGIAKVQTTADPNQQPQINVPPDGATVTIIVQNTCGNLIGKVVTDVTRTGIPNATVTMVGTNLQMTTDANGNFQFNCVRPAGQKTVLAPAPACGSNIGTANVPTSGNSQQVVIPLNCNTVRCRYDCGNSAVGGTAFRSRCPPLRTGWAGRALPSFLR
jgi:carboxypeptidase family protein